ncbi:MAG: DUF971 domain-containing protein [Methylococcales bacterium]|nr:DUF971 domain-containing protein [Methylococcales bacterium]
MSDKQTASPIEINLHQKSRVLVVSFDDGKTFDLPCEYLRVFSKAAEVVTLTEPVTGKQKVNIEKIEAQGSYAIRIFFDDGHDTGIYSWETLHKLGLAYKDNWAKYLESLKAVGYDYDAAKSELDEEKTIKVLYFVNFVRELGKESEEITVPKSVIDISTLLAYLRKRGERWERLLQEDRVQVMVNKAISEMFTVFETGDEIGLVPCGGIGVKPEEGEPEDIA